MGAKTPQIGDVGLLARVLVGVDAVEALDRVPVSLWVRAVDHLEHATVRVEDRRSSCTSRPHIVATSSMSERIGPA